MTSRCTHSAWTSTRITPWASSFGLIEAHYRPLKVTSTNRSCRTAGSSTATQPLPHQGQSSYGNFCTGSWEEPFTHRCSLRVWPPCPGVVTVMAAVVPRGVGPAMFGGLGARRRRVQVQGTTGAGAVGVLNEPGEAMGSPRTRA